MVSTDKERYAAAAQEDRSAPRSRISIPASLRPSGFKNYQTVVRDLSLAGFSAAAITRIPPNTMCWLTLPGMAGLEARVAWVDNARCGCAFSQPLHPAVFDRIVALSEG